MSAEHTALIVLGINAFHADAAACLVRDGRLVAAAEEERFTRMKHAGGFPAHAIRYCLDEAGIALRDVDHVAINQDRTAARWRRLLHGVLHRPDARLVLQRLRNRRAREGVRGDLERTCGRYDGAVHFVEHHLCHLASACAVATEAEAVAVSLDGFGDFASAAWGVTRGGRLSVAGRVYFPHSLGLFYQAFTQYLGFPHYGDEYKVMGLAAYGRPRHLDVLRDIVRLRTDGGYRLNLAYFRHARERIHYGWESGGSVPGVLYSDALVQRLGPARVPHDDITGHHRDLAASVQACYEEAFFHLLRSLRTRYGGDALVLAGGCAHNSVANGRIRDRVGFRRIHVQPAAGDAGGALGAACLVAHRLNGREPSASDAAPVMPHAYWGPAYDDGAIEQALQLVAGELREADCRIERAADQASLCDRTAATIAAGRVVGWFQGRMEWGARALGNRSVLADPRHPDIRALLNAKIKRREAFRPFAPSILREAVSAWFDVDDDVPFMTHVYPVRPERRALIPAVTHVDGSGRLHTVTRDGNALFHALIEAFGRRTGVPLLLNTSFNENEPIVRTPSEALACFLRTGMDALVLGNYTVTRTTATEER